MITNVATKYFVAMALKDIHGLPQAATACYELQMPEICRTQPL